MTKAERVGISFRMSQPERAQSVRYSALFGARVGWDVFAIR
jgi:hypothetical protein